ncbi:MULTISPECIES: PoNe immunity protein domain-containing protein [unclassified Listeria]|uniref:PoNe immunity protein domain-containing protein n=1 Tax=unclassified Listeria TaxID=2642072 RepID=UPI000B5947EF|nr:MULTISPECIES: PoNe immunity protein domain-containing protein [unclassified Listeria]
MRDIIKDSLYFENHLNEINRLIKKYADMKLIIIGEYGENSPRVRTANIILSNYYLDKINSLYSMGKTQNEIKEVYSYFVETLDSTWDKETGSYIQLLQAVSLGIFLEETKELEILQQLVQREGFHDFLIDYMFHSVDNSWVKTNELAFTRPYETLKAVTQAHTKEVAETLLKQYVEKEWYQGHRDAGWYNSHKSPHAIYNGYWSYESGAVAKIMQLNDAEFQTIKYYPYDFVQYEQ